ncbi:MAG: Ig-like domain-containing protein, partial [Candidatus Methanomethylicaceae archaeon]
MEMKRSNQRNPEIFYILFVIFSFLLILKGVWAQPSIISVTPADKSFNNPINTKIKIQFSTSMNPASGWVLVEDEFDTPVEGNLIWSQTVVSNDTLTFIPDQALKPGTHYEIEGSFSTADGHDIIGFEFYFTTKPSTADATPPRIQTTFPYNGMTNFPVGETIYIKFSEAMNPSISNGII